MKKIKIEELPDILTENDIEILVDMALENPKLTFDWRDISLYLREKDLNLFLQIMDRVHKKQKALEQEKEDAKSEDQKQMEAKHNLKFYENLDPNGFYGNMGQPETPEEFKNRYGVWPPGYDENGNRLPDNI